MASADFESLHEELVRQFVADGVLPAPAGAIQPILKGDPEDIVADSGTKSLLLDPAGVPAAVLMVSNDVNPHLMKRTADNAAAAKALLGPALGGVVLEPLASDYLRGLSYVLWPWASPLSERRVLRYFQRRALGPGVVRWLREAARGTCRELTAQDTQSAFALPLEAMSKDGRFPQAMQSAAETGLERLRSGEWRPMAALQHGDFSFENLLLRRRAPGPSQGAWRFHVIDWGGANLRGYPFQDLVWFVRGSKISPRAVGGELRATCGVFACEPKDVLHYLLAGLAATGMHLEHFPEYRYLRASTGVFAYASRMLGEG